jgi:hypothetical protein
MSSAKKDAIRNVRLAAVALPLVDVMGFTRGWWSIAAREATSAVPDRHPDALALGEESLDPSDVYALAVVVELDGYGTGVAEVTFDGLERDRVGVALDLSTTRPSVQCLFRHDHTHRRTPLPEHRSRVGVDRYADDVDQCVGGDLLAAARILKERFGIRLGCTIDKSRTAASRTQNLIDR